MHDRLGVVSPSMLLLETALAFALPARRPERRRPRGTFFEKGAVNLGQAPGPACSSRPRFAVDASNSPMATAPAANAVVSCHAQWLAIRERIARSKTVIDLGCGANPIEGATAAVDAFPGAEQRAMGGGKSIDAAALSRRGIRFVRQRIDVPLPFADQEFDFAYSHHVFEHLEDPETACREMARIARAGVIVTPAVFAEIAFGRPYHRWLVVDGDDELFFFEKTAWDYGPFGVPVAPDARGQYEMRPDTTPFDAALDDGGWHRGSEDFGALRERLQWHYRTRSPVFDVIFHWTGSFGCRVVRRRQSSKPALAPWMPGPPT